MTDDGNRTYIAIDLKSFYASVECVARGLDPLTTNLVVADESRTEKTICLHSLASGRRKDGIDNVFHSGQKKRRRRICHRIRNCR